MKKYLKHVDSLYQRPTLNGIEGQLEERYANPFELFFDLVFVIALSKLAVLLKSSNILMFIQAILMFSVIYSVWFTLTKYTVMFLKKETNYWTRLMVFIVMLPMIFFLSIEDITTPIGNFTLYFTLAISKFALALIFRDSIENAPINHITASHVYRSIAKYKIVVAGLLMINAVIMNVYIQLLVLFFISIVELQLIPKRTRKIQKEHRFKMPLNYDLFIERQLLFLILVFGESLVSVIHHIDYTYEVYTIFNVIVMFTTMFLFYTRVSEEVEHNPKLIKKSNNIYYWLKANLAVFILYQEISDFNHQIKTFGHIEMRSIIIISLVLVYYALEHLRMNKANLKGKKDKQERLFYKTDIRLLYIMLVIPVILLLVHPNILIINLLLMIYFILNVAALPYREHLIKEKLDEIFHEEYK